MASPGAPPDLGDAAGFGPSGHSRNESAASQATLVNNRAQPGPKGGLRWLQHTDSDGDDDAVAADNNQRFPVTAGTPAGPKEAPTTPSAGQPTAAAPRNVPTFTTAAQAVVDQLSDAETGPDEGPFDERAESGAQSDDGGCTDRFSTTEDEAEQCDCDLCRRAAAAAGDVAGEHEQAQSGQAAPQHDSSDCCCCLGCCDCDNSEPVAHDQTPIEATPQPESCDCCCCRGCWCCVEHLRSVEDVAPSLDPRQYKWTVIGSVREGTDLYADVVDESGVAWRRELVGAPCTDVEEEESDDDAASFDEEMPEDKGLGDDDEESSDDEPLPPMPTVDQDAEDRALELQFEKIRARMKNVREDNQGSIWNNGHRAEVVEGSSADVEDNLDEEDLYTDAGEDYDAGDDDSDDDDSDNDDGDDSCDDDDDADDSDNDDDDDDYDTDDVDECYLVVVTNSGGSHMTP